MNLQLHATGASFVAQKSAKNPRDIVASVLEDLPDAECSAQFEQFRKLLSERDDDFQRAVDFYFFVNMRSYMITNRSRAPSGSPIARAQRRKIEEIKQKVSVLSLHFVMPSGKSLKDCTGTECIKAGGWLAKIGKKVGSRKVGSVFADDAALAGALK